MEEFVQEFRRVAKGSKYKERPLMEEFKRGISAKICWKLMKLEWQPSSIEQWYDWAIILDRNWRESRREETEGMIRAENTGSKATRGTQANDTTSSDMAKETGGILMAGSNRTCSDRRSRKNKHDNSVLSAKSRICSM